MDDERKVLQFGKPSDNVKVYLDIAKRRLEDGDYIGALGVMFSVLDGCVKKDRCDVLVEIAKVYTQMGMTYLSNRYLFEFIEYATEVRIPEACDMVAFNCVISGDKYAAKEALTYCYGGETSKESEDGWRVLDTFLRKNLQNGSLGVIYTPEHSNYYTPDERMRLAFKGGRIDEFIEKYAGIPEAELTGEENYALTMAYFYSGNDKKAVDRCVRTINKGYGGFYAYCALFDINTARGDKNKKKYYYSKLLECAKTFEADYYRLAICAAEQCDHERVLEFVFKILAENPYSLTLNYYAAIAAINTGNFSAAERFIGQCLKVNREDGIFIFYSDFVKKLAAGDKTAQSSLPLKYEKTMPKKYLDKYSKLFSSVLWENPTKKSVEKAIEAAKLCIYLPDEFVSNLAVVVLITSCEKDKAIELARNAFLSPDIQLTTKMCIAFTLTSSEFIGEFKAESHNCLVDVNIRKTPFNLKEPFGAKMHMVYANCVMNLMISGGDLADRTLTVLERYYNDYSETLKNDTFSPDDIAAAAILSASGKGEVDIRSLCLLFQTTPTKVKKLLKELSKYDNKNN